MKSVNRSPSRSLGERAFDRCFYPFGLILALSIIGLFGELVTQSTITHRRYSEAELSAAPASPSWHSLLPVALGAFLCAYWIWALCSVLRAWRDPRARVLRSSALFLLIFDAGIIASLFSIPFAFFD